MNDSFAVVTDVKEIARLNERLAEQLRMTFAIRKTREITYPAGHHTGTIFFESAAGSVVRAWSPFIAQDRLLNFILAGDPESGKWMEISVQLNFPAGKYNRRMAGAFVKDARGDIFIAHRGKLTKGNAGLEKAKVFREFGPRRIDATDGEKESPLILISALDDPALPDRLWEFGEQAREVATRLGEDRDRVSTSRIGAAQHLLKLRAYFDEYAGEGRNKGHAGGKRVVEHGDIVEALEAKLRRRGTSQKAQAIDLAIVGTKAVELFEVKTSARTTDVYTGVGQLLIHGECIRELLDLPVRRHLVVPDKPKASHRPHIAGKAEVNVVVFEKRDGQYLFSGLP